MTDQASSDSREPRECASCGTVNPWMNERCRACDAVLPEPALLATQAVPAAAGPAIAVEGEKPGFDGRGRRRIGIRWILGGAGLFLLIYAGIEFGLKIVIIADDNPDLAPLQFELERGLGRERVGQHTPLDRLDDEQKDKLRDALLGNEVFVFGVFAMLLLPPFLGGLLVGRFSGSLLEAAAACGTGAFFGGAFIGGDIWVGLALLVIMAPLGLPGAVLGRYRRSRRGTVGAV